MSEVMKSLFTLAVNYSQRILAAIIIYFIGSRLIQHQLKRLPTLIGFKRLDSTVQSFTLALTKYGLYSIAKFVITCSPCGFLLCFLSHRYLVSGPFESLPQEALFLYFLLRDLAHQQDIPPL